MRSISAASLFGVARVRAHLSDGFADEKKTNATGFWFETAAEYERKRIFVTNKHVVDPRLVDPKTPFRLDRLSIALRSVQHLEGGGQSFGRETEYFDVADLEESLFVGEAAEAPDCAIVCDPTWHRDPVPFEQIPFGFQEFVADEQAFQRGDVELCDRVSFIGFPETRGGPWWDEATALPIVREATIASPPRVPSFTNKHVKTSATLLVCGLSFAGSSGSPVIAHGRLHGVPTARSFTLGETPSLLIGIMSGHFDEGSAAVPEMFRHGGLSYLTRSSAILDLIEQARANGFRNPRPFKGLHSVRQADVFRPPTDGSNDGT